MKNFKTVIAPAGCSGYLTQGKEYEVSGIDDLENNEETSFWITNDIGSNSYCLLNHCAHLNGGNWIIKEEAEQ